MVLTYYFTTEKHAPEAKIMPMTKIDNDDVSGCHFGVGRYKNTVLAREKEITESGSEKQQRTLQETRNDTPVAQQKAARRRSLPPQC
jgi:hypothetical protein